MQMAMGIGLMVIGVFIAVAAVHVARNTKGIAWERVPGVVTLAKVAYAGEYFDPVIEFAYQFRGRELRSRTIRRGTVVVNWRSRAEEVVAAYPVGQPVTVYVNPDNPLDALLEPAPASYTGAIVLGILAVLTVFGGVMLLERA
jgi:hypothetical protein